MAFPNNNYAFDQFQRQGGFDTGMYGYVNNCYPGYSGTTIMLQGSRPVGIIQPVQYNGYYQQPRQPHQDDIYDRNGRLVSRRVGT